MRRRVLRLLTILILSAAALSATAWSSAIFNNQQGNQQVKEVDDLWINGRLKTLRERAQERDVEIVLHDPEIGEFDSLPMMAGRSSAIVVGRINGEEAEFSKRGTSIVTTYTVDVHHVLKANMPLTSPLTFTRTGGVVQVNGHRASYKVEGFDLIKPGKNYVLFLQWIPYREGYILTGGMSSVFIVKGNSRVKSLATGESSQLKLRYDGTDLEALISWCWAFGFFFYP